VRKTRFRPSPAMVVALVALFVALGGVGWAAATIGTNDIQDGAVTAKKLHANAVATKKIRDKAVNGAKVKDDSLTGTDIQESTLGQVPSADHANTADTANTANTANSATTASSADNALALGGNAPSAYESSNRILYGTGRSNSTSPQLLFSSSLANFNLFTDGDVDTNTQLLLVNNNASGNLIGTPFTTAGTGAAFGILHGTSGQIGPASGTGTDFLDTLITDAGNPDKSVWLHCLFNFDAGIPTVFCWGTQA
jgi:hypothetical protein